MPSRSRLGSFQYQSFLSREKSQNSQKGVLNTTYLRLVCLFAATLSHHPIDRHAQMLDVAILHAERDARCAVEALRLGRSQQLGELGLGLTPLARLLG